MLTLRKLEMRGFGPYAEKQTVEFPSKPGVTLIYGQNMSGKTSLLNAIRYAFFETVLGRGSRKRRLHTVSNRTLAAQGEYGFKVGLTLVSDGDEYELVRTCKSTKAVPQSDADYEHNPQLRRGSSVLGPGQRDAALARILPSDISRFFLFDGELLQEYEKLLYEEEDEDSDRISQAIEQILGVPLLKRARAHLAFLADEADGLAAKEASKSKSTEAIGNALKAATDLKKQHLEDIGRLQEDLKELRRQKTDAEAFLANQKKWLTIIQERDNAEKQLGKLEAKILGDAANLRTQMADAWRTVLSGPVEAARLQAAEQAKGAIDQLTMQLRQEAVEEGHCRVCDQDVDDSRAEALIDTLEDNSASTVDMVGENLVDLNRFKTKDISSAVTNLTGQLALARSEVAQLKDQIKDWGTALADADVDRIQGDAENLGEVMEKIAAKKTAVEDHRTKVKEADASIKNLQANLAKVAPTNLQASQIRSGLLRNATEVFEAAVEHYKAELRGRVELTATELFLLMTTEESDYAGLRITESYGLELMHKDQQVEDGRSAGAEHVIALSLMGALQANAPIRGPIIMDSPFGRLDPGHRENVIAALPQMAEQVILLAHRGEVRQHNVREILGNKLVCEYEMKKLSARKTIIEKVT